MAYNDGSSLEVWNIVNVVLTGIFIKPLFIIWLVSLCLARRKGDHARVGFTWLKLVFPFYVLALVLYVVAGGVFLVMVTWVDDQYSSYSDYGEDTYNTLYNIEVRVGSVGSFFDDVATALLLVTLVEIGNGFLYVLTQTRTGLQVGLRWATIGMAGLIVVLSVARLGLSNTAWSIYFDFMAGRKSGSLADGPFANDLRTVRHISMAVTVLFWVVALGLVGFGSYVVHVCRVRGMALRSSAVIFLVATILLFIRYTWNLAAMATWILPESLGGPPLAYNAVDPIFNAWIMFVILVLLFVVGIRKKKGMWTTHQPWMNQVPPQGAPGQGGWAQGGFHPQQPQAAYQQYPPQQYAYAAVPQPQQQQPHNQQQGWVQHQQPMQQYSQVAPGYHGAPASPPPRGISPELAQGELREK